MCKSCINSCNTYYLLCTLSQCWVEESVKKFFSSFPFFSFTIQTFFCCWAVSKVAVEYIRNWDFEYREEKKGTNYYTMYEEMQRAAAEKREISVGGRRINKKKKKKSFFFCCWMQKEKGRSNRRRKEKEVEKRFKKQNTVSIDLRRGIQTIFLKYIL